MVGASARDIRQSVAVSVPGEVIPPRDLATVTRAENFDDYSGVQLVDETKVDGTAVAASGAGQWVKYADAQLHRPATFTARVASAGNTADVEIRLDSPTGPLLGTAHVPSTGDAHAYTTVAAPLTPVSGRHAVYVVLGDGVRLATFTLA
jgi:beta-glucosidase